MFMGLKTMKANYLYPHHRSQKTSALQKDSGLYAASSGMSLPGLSAGQILGYSTTPRNVQQLKADLSKGHANYISQQLQRQTSSLGSLEVCYSFASIRSQS